jgi:hypothetical protein
LREPLQLLSLLIFLNNLSRETKEVEYNNNMKRSTQTWSDYLNNRNATKNPKTFNLTLKRNTSGEFEIIGHNALMQHKTGHAAKWVRVNARELSRAIRRDGISVK